LIYDCIGRLYKFHVRLRAGARKFGRFPANRISRQHPNRISQSFGRYIGISVVTTRRSLTTNYNGLSQELAFEIRQVPFFDQRQVVLVPGVRIRIRVRKLVAIVVLVERKQYAQHVIVVVIQRPVVMHSVHRYPGPETTRRNQTRRRSYSRRRPVAKDGLISRQYAAPPRKTVPHRRSQKTINSIALRYTYFSPSRLILIEPRSEVNTQRSDFR